MTRHNLFTLISPTLLSSPKYLSMNVYNVLFELLTEKITGHMTTGPHPEFNGEEMFIQNSGAYRLTYSSTA